MSAETHDHPPHLAHHFENIEQQNETNLLGMWLFLVTEIMFFGGLFAAYAVYRYRYPDAWLLMSSKMDVTLGTVNTCILLTSSFTMVLAVHFAKQAKRFPTLLNLFFTLALAGGFLGVKAVEYSHKFHDGLFIGSLFTYTGPLAEQLHLSFVLYFFMTGLHAFHVIIGMGLIMWLMYMAWNNKFVQGRFMPVELTGLYWHLVDLIWVYLFPLFYLVGTLE